MPYIKEKLRENYNPLIDMIILKQTANLHPTDEVKLAILRIRLRDLKEEDGHVNYFITRLFKRAEWVQPWKGYYDTYENDQGKYFKRMIIKLLTGVYLDNECYFNYNRLTGVIVCIADEFTRRYDKEATCVVMLLNDVKKHFDKLKGKYEDKKIKENGDVVR